MNGSTVISRLERLANEEIDIAEDAATWSPSVKLVEDLGLDSLKMMTLAVAIEDHFEIILEPADEQRIGSVGTVAELVAVIEEKLSADDGSHGGSDQPAERGVE